MQGTPSGLGATRGDDFGVSDEEDKKPSIEYLDSLNDYRKRSRSREDVGTPRSKVARMSDIGFDTVQVNGNGNGHLPVPEVVEPEEPGIVEERTSSDDPIVYGQFLFLINGLCYSVNDVSIHSQRSA